MSKMVSVKDKTHGDLQKLQVMESIKREKMVSFDTLVGEAIAAWLKKNYDLNNVGQ